MDDQQAYALTGRILQEIRKVIVGQDEVAEQMTAALVAGGHALLEGVPGTAKTLVARTLALVTGAGFRRIQFTPDLMPSDIVGVTVYNPVSGEFAFRPGPLFADIVLADEINRSPAKTQSALLEAMEEHQASVDGVTRPMSPIFTVFATQNPVEFEGTYPLPEAQVDRFLFKISMGYPDESSEGAILDRVEAGFEPSDLTTAGVRSILDVGTLQELRAAVRRSHVEEKVRRYVTKIVRSTRSHAQVSLGASPRAGVMLMAAAKAFAVIAGRQFVTPDDVKIAALPGLRHRLILLPEVEVEGGTTDDTIRNLLASVEVPR